MKLCLLCGESFINGDPRGAADWRSLEAHAICAHRIERKPRNPEWSRTLDFAQLPLMLDVRNGEGYIQKM